MAEDPAPATSGDIDWGTLRDAAEEAARGAYAPYSRLRVGAAALATDGRVVTGCNVENVSYGLTLCAECGLVSALHASGGGRIVALVVVDGEGAFVSPCGRCRQVLAEHAVPGMMLDTVNGVRTIEDLLPDAFGPREVEGMR